MMEKTKLKPLNIRRVRNQHIFIMNRERIQKRQRKTKPGYHSRYRKEKLKDFEELGVEALVACDHCQEKHLFCEVMEGISRCSVCFRNGFTKCNAIPCEYFLKVFSSWF